MTGEYLKNITVIGASRAGHHVTVVASIASRIRTPDSGANSAMLLRVR